MAAARAMPNEAPSSPFWVNEDPVPKAASTATRATTDEPSTAPDLAWAARNTRKAAAMISRMPTTTWIASSGLENMPTDWVEVGAVPHRPYAVPRTTWRMTIVRAPKLAMRTRSIRALIGEPAWGSVRVDMPPSMTDLAGRALWAGRLADIVTAVNSVAVKPPGTRLVKAGAIAFAAVVVSWVIYALLSGKDGALVPVDLTVYRDGGLIVRHVRPYYDPNAYGPLYHWGGYSSLALKFTYTPFAAVAFAVISFIPMKPLEVLSIIVNIASLLVA